ncbi:hypothetical protein NQ314_003654 [Rhamnusium bicolor]|uniref:Multidrug resistance-associated protein lethal(2)03659 n=1 Tax=Rhamnusium bicolor TaxID=1586634 RepID=A0AAV8ZNK6_9CUCU|nr:hypothetical protein NQ314_003654 [Rhamnusium bicolor]
MRSIGSEEERKENARQNSNWLSIITFWYTLKLFHEGRRRELDESDLTKPLDEHKSELLGQKIATIWSKEYDKAIERKGTPSMAKVIIKTFYCDFVTYGLILVVMEMLVSNKVPKSNLVDPDALRIKLTALEGRTVGNAVNLMSNDVTRFDMAPIFLHYLWIAPLQVICIIYFLYREVQFAAVIGMSAVACVIPFQVCLGIRTSFLRDKAAARTDERVRQMNEIIQSMQVIKMYAWENAFAELINNLRKNELKILLKTSYIRGIIMSFIMFTARSGIFLTILSYVLLGNDITAEKVFVVTSYYLILRQTMTVYFPQGVAMMAESSVSIKRIQKFMLTEETHIGDPTLLDPKWKNKPKKVEFNKQNPGINSDETPRITVVHGIAKYGNDICLDDINLEVWPGKLTAIVGSVGAGKSCLLTLILGELSLFSGRLIAKGVMSYASQEPWLFAGSVRQNILFGRPFEINHYRDVVKACALTRDFSLLPYGDRSIVGEKGISLSGGQRARVNLARAVYKRADIYLLDDPLSAVDIHVGAIQGKGTYSDLKGSGLEFATLLEEQSTALPMEEKEKVLRAVSITSAAFNSMIDIEGRKSISLNNASGYQIMQENLGMTKYINQINIMVNLEELRSHFGTAEVMGVYNNLNRQQCILIYTTLIMATIIVALTRSVIFFSICMRSSMRLHNRMFSSIIHASMRFFNINTSGRILNRFSKDLGAVDELLPNACIDTTQVN